MSQNCFESDCPETKFRKSEIWTVISNQMIESISFPIRTLIKLVIINTTSTYIESYPLSCYKSSRWRCFVKKDFLRNFVIFTGKQLRWSLFLIKLQSFGAANLLQKISTQVFSCEYCKIPKNTYFEKHPRTSACAISPSSYFVGWFLLILIVCTY